MTQPLDPAAQLHETCLDGVRGSLRAFLYALAPTPGEYQMTAPHLQAFCRELQAATEAVERGECYYVIVTCPPQHWKSTTCAQVYPIWHMGRHPDHRILQVSYSASIAKRNSRFARRVVEHPVTVDAFGLKLDPKSRSVEEWTLADHLGGMRAAGFGGGITGHPADVIVVDDYFKSREEAESQLQRDKVWDSFTNEVLTRRAPVHAVVIMATLWHEDGLISRIEQAMKDDSDFPKFKVVKFPAWTPEYGWLFSERFSEQFYKSTRVALGSHAWSSLYMCNPTPREGGLLKVDNVKFLDAMPEGLQWCRAWDLASGRADRTKSDPDWSAGTKVAVTADPEDERILHLFVGDMVKVQAEAPERDRLIDRTADRDGPEVKIPIEAVAGYKDAGVWLKRLLKGKAKVIPISVSKDLVTRGEPMEPVFEAGHVYVQRAEWNAQWLSELRSFPNGKHDDMVSSLILGFEYAAKKRNVIFAPLDSFAAKPEELDRSTPGPHVRDVDIAPELVGAGSDDVRLRIMNDGDAWS